MKKKLEWYAFMCDFNSKKIVKFNVIYDDLIDEIKKAKKKHQLNSVEDLKKIVKSNFMWHYWSKCEYEYNIGDLFGEIREKKDVWFQLEMNLDRIAEYLWNNL